MPSRTGKEDALTYRLVIFDFDGTLVDTFPWFVRVMNTVADRFGFKRIEEHEVERLRGHSAREIIKHLDVPNWKLPLIARHMRALAAQDVEAVRLFDGVGPMLRQLSDAKVKIAIVSSNSEHNIRRALGPEVAPMVNHYACGASLFGKPAKFRKVLRESGIARRQAICVGDEIRDHEAAKRAGLAFGAVAWGFTSAEALKAQSPAEMFFTPAEIVSRLVAAPGPTAQHRPLRGPVAPQR
jgi:phosphoglycolate phosphatase